MTIALDPIQHIEARRIAAGLAIEQLATAAGLSRSGYRKILLGTNAMPPRRATIARLKAALSRLAGRPADLAAQDIRYLFYTFQSVLALVCHRAGVATADVYAHDPSRRATSDPAWLRASRLRRQAIYLVNAGLGVDQADIAKAVGLTPAAISLACQAIETEREEGGELDLLLDELTRTITGDLG